MVNSLARTLIQLNYYPFLSRNLPLYEFRTHLGRDDCAEKFDRAQDGGLRLVADRHLHEITLGPNTSC